MTRPVGSLRFARRAAAARRALGFAGFSLAALSLVLAGCRDGGGAGGRQETPPRDPAAVAASPAPVPETAFVRFEDATAATGLRFRHVNGASGRRFMPETLGAGVCVFDYDGDDRQDIYLVQSGRLPGFTPAGPLGSALYRNLGGGRFEEVTAAAGVGGPDRYGFGCVAGDVDGDGDRDLYVTYYGPNVLYRNEGEGRFVDATAAAGVGDRHWSTSAGLADYDGDGWLDLYVANYVDYDLDGDLYCGENRPGYRTVCHPKNFDGQPDRLYRNRGDGTFEDVSGAAGIGHLRGKGLGVVWGDYDGDGDADLYVANDDTPNFLLRNEGDGRLSEIGELAGVALSEDGMPQAGMGTDMADYDNDGRPDLFVTNLAEETNELYRNEGGDSFSNVTFSAGLGAPSLLHLGFGAFFFDPDHDGRLDLFVANGHIIDNIELYSDTVTFEQRPDLYRNLGDGRLVPAGAAAGEPLARRYVARGAVPFDYDDDGDEDILMTQNDRPVVVLRNAGAPAKNWLTLTLIGSPPNRDAIGARVAIVAGGRRQERQLRTARSYLSQGDRRIHFGLGEAPAVERIEVHWPGRTGFAERFDDIVPGRFVTLEQGRGARLPDVRPH